MRLYDRVRVTIDTSTRGWPGLSRGKRPSDFNPTQLRMGTMVEMEHVRNRLVAQRIAMDHLTEDSGYYKKLARFHKASSWYARQSLLPSKNCEHCGTDCAKRYPVVIGGRIAMVGSSCAKRFRKAKRSDLIRSLYRAALPVSVPDQCLHV